MATQTTNAGVVIRALEPHELQTAAGVLAASFAEETLFKRLLGGTTEQRARLLPRFMLAMLRGHAPYSDVDGAFVAGRLAAVAITVKPDHFPLGPGARLFIATKVMPAALRCAVSMPGIMRLPGVVSQFEKHHPKESCHYLAFFGAHPECRKGGVAQKLTRAVLSRADAEQMGCYLDTAGRSTKRMCQFFGFEVRHELRPLTDGPTCWGMWRSPR